MPVCQFFLEGRCRYGERCRNEHPRGGVQRNLFGGGGGGGGERKITFRDSFNNAGQNEKYKWSSSNQQNQATSQSSLDVVSNLPKEMETFESSKMWPLTCIGLEGYTKSLPDFVDTSFEELRLAAYQALKENNFKTFADRYHQQLEEVKTKRDVLKHFTMETKSKLISFLDAARTQLSQGPETHGSEMNTSSLFNQQKTNSAFNSLSLFSQQSPVTGSHSNVDLLSTGPNTWFSFSQSAPRGGDVGRCSSTAAAASHSLGSTVSFGKPAATVTSSSVTNFGTPAMTLFGKPVKSLFGEENKPTTNQNIFSQPSSIFGGNAASTFGGNAASTFGGNAASTIGGSAASTFGGNAASTFGGNAASTFGGNTASTFGGNAASSFGGNTASTFGGNAASTFGGNAASTFGGNNASTFGGNTASTFGGNAASSFGGNAASTFGGNNASTFGRNTASTFGGNAASSFGGNAASTFGGNNASTFGGNGIIGGFVSSQTSTPLIQSSPGKPFPKTTVAQASGIYSQLTDLNDKEKEAFMAKSFQLGHIPLRPPPVELIN